MSFETLAERLNEAFIQLSSSHGEVYRRTSFWRRWFKKEKWGVAHKIRGEFKMYDAAGNRVYRFGDMRLVDNPDEWPDFVCVAVAKARLSE